MRSDNDIALVTVFRRVLAREASLADFLQLLKEHNARLGFGQNDGTFGGDDYADDSPGSARTKRIRLRSGETIFVNGNPWAKRRKLTKEQRQFLGTGEPMRSSLEEIAGWKEHMQRMRERLNP